MSKQFFIFASLFSSLFVLLYLVEPIKLFVLKESGQAVSSSYIFLFIVIYLLLLVFIYFAFSLLIKKYSLREMLIFSVFLNLILLFILPITSSDLYSYIYQSRVWTVFKASPYLSSYSQFPQDIYYDFLANSWSHRTSPYGPLFLIIKGFFSYLFSFNIWLNIYIVKLFFITLNIVNGYLVYKISESKLAFYLYAFNPLIIFEVAVNGHNDVLFIFFLLLSIYYFIKEKSRQKVWSYVFLCFSFYIKYISLFLLPIFVIFNFVLAKNYLKRLKILFIYLIIFLSLGFVFYYPFIREIRDIFQPLIEQSSYLSVSLSPLILILFSLFSLFDKYDVLYLDIAIYTARSAFLLYFIYLISSLIKKQKKEFTLIKGYYKGLLAFFLCFFTFLLPWYLISLMAISLLLLKKEAYKRPALLVFYSSTVYGIMQYILLR